MTAEDLKQRPVILPGGAGLVGQNLVALLKARGYRRIVVLDKHKANLDILRRLHPDVHAEHADLAEAGEWRRYFKGAGAVVMLQAQIGGTERDVFLRNTVESTKHILEEIKRNAISYTVHVSSSVVVSVSSDDYTMSKRLQEKLVTDSGITCAVLRPTLMFGWFDRKHLGWLSRFMRKAPVFPIPGDGRYLRQPLYAGDFCQVIAQSLERCITGTYDITGRERIDYIDLIRAIKRGTGARTPIVRIPFGLFRVLLRLWALIDRDPPFTVQQLDALAAKDIFEVTDWPATFGVEPTPLARALDETFTHPEYGNVTLEF